MISFAISFCTIEAVFVKEDRVVLLFDREVETYCNNPSWIMVNGEPVSGTSQIIQFNGNNLGYKFTFIELPNGLKDPQNAVVKYVAPPMEEEKAWNYSASNERI